MGFLAKSTWKSWNFYENSTLKNTAVICIIIIYVLLYSVPAVTLSNHYVPLLPPEEALLVVYCCLCGRNIWLAALL